MLPAFIRYFFDNCSNRFEIVSNLKDSYLSSTALLRLLDGHPRAILTAFLWIASSLASLGGAIIDGMNGAYSIIDLIRVLWVVMTNFGIAPQPLPLNLFRVFIRRCALSVMESICLLDLRPGSSVIPKNFGFGFPLIGLLLNERFIWWLIHLFGGHS